MKNIILCADDYAFNEAISRAIIHLAEKQRLSAVSCMTNMPLWRTHAVWLKPYRNKIDIGLHFNLPTLSFNKRKVKAVLERQIAQFQKYLGKNPDFIDGHQHIHQLPFIRDVLLDVYEKRLKNTGCAIRIASQHPRLLSNPIIILKTLIIHFMGAHSLKKSVKKNKIPFNIDFAGIYHFSQAKNYAAYFKKFIQAIKSGGLIMCHPGLNNPKTEDSIARSRVLEYQFFASDEFMQICKQNDIKLLRFNMR